MIDDKHQMRYALQALAALNYFTGDWAQMRSHAEQHLTIARELGATEGIADALWQMGAAACGSGDHELGRLLFEQSLELGRKENLPNIIAFALSSLARLARLDGDYARAKVLYMESAQIRRQMGFRSGLANTLLNLGQVVLHERDSVQAGALFEESLAIFREFTDIEGQVDSLAGFAGVAGVAGKQEHATQLFGATEAAYETLDSEMSTLAHMVYDPIIATVREQLGEVTFDAAWAEGRKMTLEQAVEYALETEGVNE